MGQKRPVRQANPEALARAIELRRAGKTYSDIEAEVGISRGTLCQHFKAAGLARGRDAADEATAEDFAEADDMRRTLRKVRRAINAAADLIYSQARPGVDVTGKPQDGTIDARNLAALTAAMRTAGDLERKYRGRSGSSGGGARGVTVQISNQMSGGGMSQSEQEIYDRVKPMLDATPLDTPALPAPPDPANPGGAA